MVRGAWSASQNALSPEPNEMSVSEFSDDSGIDVFFSFLLVFACIGMFTTVQWMYKFVCWIRLGRLYPQPQTSQTGGTAEEPAVENTLPQEDETRQVYTTPNGKHYHRQNCKWIQGRQVSAVSERVAVGAHYKKCHSCHDLGSAAKAASEPRRRSAVAYPLGGD